MKISEKKKLFHHILDPDYSDYVGHVTHVIRDVLTDFPSELELRKIKEI